MVLLKIDFQDGFNDDLVLVRFDGEEVFRKERVTTKLVIGYAASIERDVPEGQLHVEVILPEKGISGDIFVEVATPLYLGVSLDGNVIRFRISQSMFAYL
jgi:hypothetical protein